MGRIVRLGTIRYWLVAILALAAAAALAACATAQEEEEKVIRIGATVSDTGRYAEEGKHTRRGYLLWEEWVNEEYGGIKVGNDRYRAKLILFDDASEPDNTASLYRRIIEEDQANFLLGPYSSTLTRSAIEVADEKGVVMVEGNGASESLFQQSYTNLFAVLTPAAHYTRTALESLAGRGAQSIAIAHVDALFPASVAAGAERWAGEYGLEVLGVETYSQDAEDVTGILRKYKELDPDIFLGGVYFADALKFVRAAREVDFNPRATVLTVGPSSPRITEELGADSDYLIGPTQWQASMDYRGDYFGSAADYAARYQDKWGEAPAYQGASATAAALALHLAIEEAGSLEMEAVRDGLRNLAADTFYGPISFDSTGKNADRPMGAIQVQQGEIKVVAPEESAVADLLYPAPPWQER